MASDPPIHPVDPRPVLLVPGAFGQDYLYWNVLGASLKEAGLDVHTMTFPTLTLSDLRDSARLLANRVDELRRENGGGRLALVAHSMGGLIARYYLRFLKGHEAVCVLVCLGVPHRGTLTAASGLALKGARQALPGSPFLKRLNGGDGRHGVPIVNIYSTTDFIVVPRSSAVLEHPEAVNFCAPLAGHWGLLVSRRVRAWVKDAIDDPPAIGEAATMRARLADRRASTA